ncbi:MAG: proton-conducting transporter transmembrane domain-containing protein [Myxococcaceae bacterium]
MEIFSHVRDLVLASADTAGEAAPLTVQAFKRVGYLWLIPFFPMVGAAVNAILGLRIQRAFGKKTVSAIAIGAMVASFAVALWAFFDLRSMPEHERFLLNHLWNMFTAGDVQANLTFALDPLSMMMTLVITFIGTLIHIYSVGYMADDPDYWRFFSYLNLFVFAMLLLVMGDNFVLMFFGWEGVGLCSYLLIGFWYKDIEKSRAAVKAFVTNRFGDFGFVLGLFLLFWALGGGWEKRTDVVPARESTWALADPARAYEVHKQSGTFYSPDGTLSPNVPPSTWSQVEAQTKDDGSYSPGPSVATRDGSIRVGPTLSFRELRDEIAVEKTGVKERLAGMSFFGIPLLALVGILLFVGATAKSAQIPLYVWLPDAMAGPTPVSALIHAATMVTAGVYMVARLNFLFALSTTAMTVIAVTGAATALFAASIGFVQNDIKKVLAYSTVSQLGFMFIGVGVGAYWAGTYHLLTHAFFKACLFLGAGSVILGCHHEQDMRKMGGLKKYMPLTHKTYLYACIAISGFPIANGFFSKDEILWKAFDSGNNLLHPMIGQIIWVVGWLTALGTSFYMWRSYYMTFSGEYRGAVGHAHDAHAHAPDAGHPVPAVATHSLGAAHAATFDADAAAHADTGHGHHGGLPSESPRSMTWVLAALAIGCFLTIFLGLWPPAGMHPALETWLEPVLAPSHALVTSRGAGSSHTLEWVLMIASVAVAFGGWLTARALYKDYKSTVPATLKAKFPKLHRWVENKYYVDEAYQKTVLAGSWAVARACSFFDRVVVDGAVNATAAVGRFFCDIDGAIDKYLVDGAVNFIADSTLTFGRALRRVQTGRIENYLYAAVAGALAVVAITFLVR